MTDKYHPAYKFLSSLGHNGADLADFLRNYGIDVAAVQLGVDTQVLKKALAAMVPLEGLGKTLTEVAMRRGTSTLALTPTQRANFAQLLVDMRLYVGTTELARRLGVSRQALYHVASKEGPATVSTMVLSIAGLLGYNSVLDFLEKLNGGVPSCTHIERPKRKTHVKA